MKSFRVKAEEIEPLEIIKVKKEQKPVKHSIAGRLFNNIKGMLIR